MLEAALADIDRLAVTDRQHPLAFARSRPASEADIFIARLAGGLTPPALATAASLSVKTPPIGEAQIVDTVYPVKRHAASDRKVFLI